MYLSGTLSWPIPDHPRNRLNKLVWPPSNPTPPLLLGALNTIPTKVQSTREEFEEAFRAINHDKDGQIDIAELERLMEATGFGVAGTELRGIFSRFDRDGSGKVDLEEFVDYMMDA